MDWITIDAHNREEARNILPPASSSQATVVKLNTFTREMSGRILGKHEKN